jgi:hypothetical protein
MFLLFAAGAICAMDGQNGRFGYNGQNDHLDAP